MKVYEATKGSGENQVTQRFTVKTEADKRKIENFIFCGWSVKEVRE